MSKENKMNRKNVYTAFTLGMIILSTLLTGGCLDSGSGPQYTKGVIGVDFAWYESSFRLNRTEYEKYLEEGPINATLRKEFEKRNYSIDDNATLYKADDEYGSMAEWVIYVNGTEKYGVVGVEESDPILVGRLLTLDRAKELVHSLNCTAHSWWKKNESDGRWEAIVNVPEGEEKKYARLFEEHPIVYDAYYRFDQDA